MFSVFYVPPPGPSMATCLVISQIPIHAAVKQGSQRFRTSPDSDMMHRVILITANWRQLANAPCRSSLVSLGSPGRNLSHSLSYTSRCLVSRLRTDNDRIAFSSNNLLLV